MNYEDTISFVTSIQIFTLSHFLYSYYILYIRRNFRYSFGGL